MAMREQPCVYVLASQRIGTLYVGVTSNLIAGLHQHRNGKGSHFTALHKVKHLVRYEFFETMPEAIAREKQLKRWHRPWKITLIESENSFWEDFAVPLGFEPIDVRPPLDGC
jgi:putative endonuclease